MTDQKRDERHDVWIQPILIDSLRSNGRSVGARWYAPHSDLVAAEQRADDAEYELKRLKSELRGMAANLDRQLHPDDDMMPRGKRIRLSMTGMLDHLEDLLK